MNALVKKYDLFLTHFLHELANLFITAVKLVVIVDNL